jgi:beta-N-acetylhexosaminidase
MAGAAVFGTPPERVRRAAEAGCDVLMICNDRAAVLSVLRSVEPDISTPASQARLVRMRARGEPPVDLAADVRRNEALATIAGLSAAPPLVLTEGQA